MEILTVKIVAEICNGKIFCGDENLICKSFTKDTRIINKGDVYVGIKGGNFNGNHFYKEAFASGAICSIIERDSFVKDESYEYNKPIILVDDSILALKRLAEYKRDNSSAFFVGVTGSVGKTSTRDMIYSVLKEEYKTLKTEGNYNNNIGLPLTLMRLEDERAAVIEMGMNALGEIDYLTRITKPHISVITNIGTAHIGELGSRENILKAKLEILNGMDENGKLVINNDNDLLHEYYLKNKGKCITIGIDNESDFQAIDINMYEDYSEFKITYDGKSYDMKCPVPGRVFVYNSLVAFAVGINLNIDAQKIKRGIENFELTKNRTEIFKINNNITIINDVYNASVDSMKSSIEILKNRTSSRKIAVLGSMLELGEYSKSLHEQVGEFVVENKIDVLITVGEDAKYIASSAMNLGMNKENIYSFLNNSNAIETLNDLLKPDDAVLLKASNGLRFIEIVENLRNNNI